MSHYLDDFDPKKADLSYYCRGCKQLVRGVPITPPQYKFSSYDDDPWLICRCPTDGCEMSFIIYDKLNSRVGRVYPLAYSEARNYHESIPEKVREDLAEADRCTQANAYRASVVMYRRAIQNIILDKIKSPEIKEKKLWEQIDELFNQGLITKDLKEAAHEIRHFGNFGAHPQDDQLDGTSRDDVEAIEQLIFSLINAVYVTHFHTEKMKAKRVGQKEDE